MTKTTLHPLRCRGCGASVPVREGLRFIDCDYCRTRHEVVIPESKTAELSATVEDLRLREELRNLDASWESYVRDVSEKTSSGESYPPSANAVVESGMMCLGGTAFAALALAQASIFVVFVVIPAGIFVTWRVVSAALRRKRAFESTKLLHESTRRDLVRRIQRNGRAVSR